MAGIGLHASSTLAQARGAMRGETREHAAEAARENGAYARLRLSIWAGADDRIVAPLNAALLARQFARLLGIENDAVLEPRNNADTLLWHDSTGRTRIELWSVRSLGHAWSGGSFRGSFTSSTGPRASDEMLAFFLGPTRRR